MTEKQPRVSFGVPVRNGEDTIRRCLDSILAQEFQDFEVVICDNASDDGTPEILQEYAARDGRIRLFMNDEDIGQIENCNRVVHLSRGEYFRWVGADDWLEPGYASACVAALDADPGAIVATTYFGLHDDRGRSHYERFQGEFLESELPERRFARMLWFFSAGATLYEPLYSMMRRDVLARTGLIRMMTSADFMLAAELSLIGRFCHVPELLFHRTWPLASDVEEQKRLTRYNPQRQQELPSSVWRFLRVLYCIIRAAPLGSWQRARCYWSALAFCSKQACRRSVRRLHRFRRERLGLSRQRLKGWLGTKASP
jgi:glycosyltransferase involved in cell wall biosynthesis